MDKQRTIRRAVQVEGIGLHTGNISALRFLPAPENYGIRFIRTDLPGKPEIPALLAQISGTAVRGTTIGNETAKVYTVEHVLSVCSGLGIDNMIIEITHNEPPVLDGSASVFAEKILAAGIVDQQAPRDYLRVTEPVVYEAGATRIVAYPADEFSIDCTVQYDHPYVGQQHFETAITPERFLRDIAPARTFCFDYEIEALKNNGLARGGDLSNAVVVGVTGIHNREPLRFRDEFVRHKLLDLMGDLFLTGKHIQARIVATRCGHNHNIGFVKTLLASIGRQPPVQRAKPLEELPMEHTPVAPGTILDINAIHRTIAHRYPFLMIDRVVIVEDAKKATGYKCVSGNEGFFQGHFPGQPIMPGVLIVEAMAQTSCVLLLSKPDLKNKLAYFMSIDGVKFRKPVVPGDVLELRIEVIRARERGGKVRGEAFVNGTLVTEAEFMFAVVEKESSK